MFFNISHETFYILWKNSMRFWWIWYVSNAYHEWLKTLNCILFKATQSCLQILILNWCLFSYFYVWQFVEESYSINFKLKIIVWAIATTYRIRHKENMQFSLLRWFVIDIVTWFIIILSEFAIHAIFIFQSQQIKHIKLRFNEYD